MEALKNVFRDGELRNKILFTLFILLVFRLGANIPVPGIDREALKIIFSDQNGLFDIFNLFSGGAFQNFTVFTLGVSPFITASIIVQLLTMGFDHFRKIADDIDGKERIEKITLYMGLGMAILESIGVTLGIFRSAIMETSIISIIAIISTLAAGSMFLYYLGNRISVKGIGNGVSMIIFAGIVAKVPSDIVSMYAKLSNDAGEITKDIIIILTVVFLLVFTIHIQDGEKRIPVVYSKKVIGRKSYGGSRTYIPMKVNQAGVIPVIFALSVISLPATISYFVPNSRYAGFISKWFSAHGMPGIFIYSVIHIALIILFTFIYIKVVFDPFQIANNLKANGGVIPGVRQGRSTIETLNNASNSLARVGTIFLAVIAVIPIFLAYVTGINIAIGGTSIIILVGVVLEVMQQIDIALLMKNRGGLLR